MNTLQVQAGLTKTAVKALVLVTGLGASPLMVSLVGCASHPHPLSTVHRIEGNRTAEPESDQRTDPDVEDSRTAVRVREALAAVADYRYDGVKVAAREGVVQLSGFVNTSVQKNSAGEITSKVAGVKSVQNNLTVKD